jgi:hypothetical protein
LEFFKPFSCCIHFSVHALRRIPAVMFQPEWCCDFHGFQGWNTPCQETGGEYQNISPYSCSLKLIVSVLKFTWPPPPFMSCRRSSSSASHRRWLVVAAAQRLEATTSAAKRSAALGHLSLLPILPNDLSLSFLCPLL